MNESILTGILIFGIIQSIFFALLFSTKKDKTLPDNIITVWLIILALQIFLILIKQQTESIPVAGNLSLLITLLYGPMLFLYVSRLTITKTGLQTADLIHFIPFFLFLVLFILTDGERSLLTKFLAGTSALSGISYCIICFIMVRNHQNNITNTFSYIEKINLNWVNRLVICLLFIWTGVLILVTLNKFLHIEVSLDWFFTTIPLFIFYIGFYGIRQQAIYSAVKEVPQRANLTDLRKTKKSNESSYVKSGLLPDTMRTIHEQLIRSMQNDELYSDPELSLTELSERVNIPAHHITQSLNDYAGINYHDFVNGFRVEAFKKKIDSGEAEKFSLLGLAFDCGFNSKSSFNRIFKNFTGLAPSGYKRKESD
jgi:AraC-like DNA-binding protein